MNLFNLVATLALNKQAYEQGLNSAAKSASSFSSKAGVAFKAVGKAATAIAAGIGVAAGAIGKLVSSAINYGDDIDKQSQKLGLSADAYQKWSIAVQMAGGDASTFQTAVRSLTNFIQDLTDGESDSMLALQQLGISYDDFMNMSFDDQLKTIVEAMQGLEEGTQKTDLAQQLFGQRAYQELMPLLNQEKGSIDELFQSYDDMGLIMDDISVKKSAQLNDKFTILKETFKSMGNRIAIDLYPEIENLVDGLQNLATGDYDKGIDQIASSISGLATKLIDRVPEILGSVSNLALNIITSLAEHFEDEKFTMGLIHSINEMIQAIIRIIPALIRSVFTFIKNIFKALKDEDWTETVLEFLDVLFEVIFVDIPNFFKDLATELLSFFNNPSDTLNKLGKIGAKLGEFIWNGVKTSAQMFWDNMVELYNALVDLFEKLKQGGKKVLGQDWLDNYLIDDGKTHYLASGGMMSKRGTLYVAGESGVEIVAQSSQGTGVANVRQIEDAQYNALARILPVFVNGIVDGLKMNYGINNSNPIIVKIGEKDFKSYVVRASNDNLNQKGRQTLNKVTRY